MNALLVLMLLFHQVTWKEVVHFLEVDHTNWVDYGSEGRTCEWFAQTLMDNARAEGIFFYRVRVDFEGGAGHIFNAVETTNLGTIYIEPQTDLRYTPPHVGGYLCDNSSGECWIAQGMRIVRVLEYDKETK